MTLDTTATRVDMHCHSTASQVSKLGVQRAMGLPECATPPEEVYELAKRRGMDFVTITDHDSIDGCLFLLNANPDLADFFISEEVETWFPETRQRIHVNVFGIDERQHREIQRLRANIYDLHAFLRQERILASAS